MRKTYITKKSDIKRKWYLFDLANQPLGRVATQIARRLLGKDKPNWAPYLDCGDWAVVINADKVRVSGKKNKNKMYRRHSGYPGGFRELSFEQMMAKDPRKIIELAVKGMLPKNKLRARRLKRLRIYAGSIHPYKDKFKN